MTTITILGAGMMGTAFAWPLADRGHTVRLVGTPLDDAIIAALESTREHPKLGLRIPEGVEPYADEELERALDGSDAVALGVSSAGVRWAAQRLGQSLRRALPLAMVSKGLGFDGTRLRVLPDVFSAALPEHLARAIVPVAVGGPCIAGELARRVPTCIVFTARERRACEPWAELIRTDYYHVFTSEDVVGVEVCAALKNAYAMGMGFAAGLHEKAGGSAGSIALHNYEAAVFAQAVWEMGALVRALGGDPTQASWLPGVGDLDVTCNGGRTGRFGRLLGLGLGAEHAIEAMQGATLECLEILSTLRAAFQTLAGEGALAIERFPLLEHLWQVALEGAAISMPFARFFGGAAHGSMTLKRSE